MKFSINVKKNSFRESLNKKAKKQIPFAAASALNSTAFKIRRDEQRAMDKHLDRPTPFTKRGVRVRKATKRNLIAYVYIAEIQAGYLKYAVHGGRRKPNKRAIPLPVGQRVNKYGNMPKSAIKRLMANDKVFSGRPVGRSPGIYKRMGTKKKPRLRMMVSYQPRATYQERYPFYDVAERRTRRTFRLEYKRAFTRAMRTAR